jgi:hypothetical protein
VGCRMGRGGRNFRNAARLAFARYKRPGCLSFDRQAASQPRCGTTSPGAAQAIRPCPATRRISQRRHVIAPPTGRRPYVFINMELTGRAMATAAPTSVDMPDHTQENPRMAKPRTAPARAQPKPPRQRRKH